MRKGLVYGLTIVALIAVSLISVPFASEISSSTSPDKKYFVKITQGRTFPFFERHVFLNASRNGDSTVRKKLLYTGDFLDNEFNALYPGLTWISGSVLEIGQGSDPKSDTIQVLNDAPYRLNYVLIETNADKYVLFDVEPGAIVNLNFRYWGRISCQTEYGQTGKRAGDALEVAEGPHANTPKQFTIRLGAEKVFIESSESASHVQCCAQDRPDIDHE